jgi:hypothetical protein
MPQALTLQIIAGMTVAGAALGLHLGQSSISEIDPSLFAEPETRFHADLVPNPAPIAGDYTAQTDGRETAGLGAGCIDCRAYPEEYYPVQDPAIESLSVDSEAPVAFASYQEQSPAAVTSRSPEMERLERYSRFRISSDEKEAPASVEAQGPAPSETEASAIQGEEVAAAE